MFAPFSVQIEHSLPSSFSSRTKTIIRGAVGSFLLLIINTNYSTFRSIFWACPQPYRLPCEFQHLHSFPLCLLYQDFIGSII
jgi:hypothetical protein